MEKLNFKFEVFEGPLDVLLHLIQKHKLNIYDIEISKLLDQYLEYIDLYRRHDMELAGEFLDMAARLIYIKTVSLLPKPETAEKEKEQLQGELIEYSICKKMSALLAKHNIGDDIFVREPMKIKFSQRYTRFHEKEELLLAYVMLNKRPDEEKAKLLAEDRVKNAVASQKPVSVMSKVVFLIRHLYNLKTVSMDELYSDLHDKSSRVAMFLAVLELTRKGRIIISDDNTEIYLKKITLKEASAVAE